MTIKPKIKYIFLCLLLLIILLSGLIWLAIGLLIIMGLFILYYSKINFFIWVRENRFFNPIIVMMFILVISISVRVFLIEVFAIPSGSMEDTLKEGDKVLVSKLNYGPALPRSPFEIPWINLIWYLQAKTSTKTDSAYWEFKRLNGYSKVKHNDILVFLHPLWGKKDNFLYQTMHRASRRHLKDYQQHCLCQWEVIA